jgi:hypothetical protein
MQRLALHRRMWSLTAGAASTIDSVLGLARFVRPLWPPALRARIVMSPSSQTNN